MDDLVVLEPLFFAGYDLLDPIMGDHLIWRQEVLAIYKEDEYYDMALIPLGWSVAADLMWNRESERLTITAARVGDANLWKIAIMPE